MPLPPNEAFLVNHNTAPAEGAQTVVPSDSVDLTYTCRALWVGGAGNIVCTFADDTTVTIAGILAGTLLPFRCKRVKATGTTATNIVAVY